MKCYFICWRLIGTDVCSLYYFKYTFLSYQNRQSPTQLAIRRTAMDVNSTHLVLVKLQHTLEIKCWLYYVVVSRVECEMSKWSLVADNILFIMFSVKMSRYKWFYPWYVRRRLLSSVSDLEIYFTLNGQCTKHVFEKSDNVLGSANVRWTTLALLETYLKKPNLV